MKKFLLAATVLTIFIIYALHTNLENESAASIAIKPNAVIPSNTPTETPISTASTPSTGSGLSSLTTSPTAQPTGKYKNGTYTGSVADAFYGNVQVQAIISGGRITDIRFLQYPNDRETSRMINSQAIPLLREEAIQAQSAQVDGVSGATATSQAFVESLQSALSQAV